MYGIDIAQDLPSHHKLFKFIADHTKLSVPKVLELGDGTSIFHSPYIVVSEVAGVPPRRGELTNEMAFDLGDYVGALHALAFDRWGQIGGDGKGGCDEWWNEVVLFMKSTVASQFASEQVMLERLDSIVKQVETLPPPKSFVPIMSDIGWRQFLSLKGRLSAVVDLETYAIGPREVELVLLEAMLTAESVQEFVAGYSSHMQLPSLAELREVYRFFCHVVGAPGVAVLEDWEKYPPLLEFGV